MRLMNKALKRDKRTRAGRIAAAAAIGIAVNCLIAAVKLSIGFFASSVAILSEGMNNAADVISSALTLIGTGLAGKRADRKHPFGYGRIEYLTGMTISAFVLLTGGEMLICSVRRLFRPEVLSVSGVSLVLLALSAAVKLLLGIYTVKTGRKTESAALEAVGIECRNDCFVSLVTIASTGIFVLFRISVDAYAGVVTSLVILKSGLDILRKTVSALLGDAGERELAEKLCGEICAAKGIQAAEDMMLHNYGPNRWSGSVTVEADHETTVGELYAVLHALRLRILHEYHVTMAFGIAAADNDHEEVGQLRETIGRFVSGQKEIRGFHAVYLDPESGRIYCDFVVDHSLKEREALRERFAAYLRTQYPQNELVLTIESEYV